MRIGVVAPSSRLSETVAEKVTALAAARWPGVQILFHPQCFFSHRHFAGEDGARTKALVEYANDPAIDAIWFGRGGYGSCRIAERALAEIGAVGRDKSWLGYSDAGYLLAGLYRAGFPNLAHGPMPQDILRDDGEAAVERALSWLVLRAPHALEPGLRPGDRHFAINLTVLSLMQGTPLEPDLSGHILLVEEVSEHLYRTDRAFFHLTGNPGFRKIAGLRLGRFSLIPDNDPEFGEDEEGIARFWCDRAGIAYLGRADIGHDSANRVVPFGQLG